MLRVFAAATPDGWTIMPGGFCRIADQPDARAVSMGDGARAADVWVVSDKAVSTATLLPAVDTVRIRRIAGVVPSRAADNLFWLGRYLERAEATLRLMRALGMQRDRRQGCRDRAAGGRADAAAAGDMGRGLADLAVAAREGRRRGAAERGEIRLGAVAGAVGAANRDVAARAAVAGCLAGHHRNGASAWRRRSRTTTACVSAAELTLQELASFAGLAQENMNRAAGWRFLEMGRRAERAINTVRFARQFAYDEAGGEDLDILLTLVDCQITYRSRYLVGPLLAPVRDLVVLDPYNPRSVAFQVSALNDHIASLPTLKEGGLIERPQRLAVALQATLTTAEAASLDTKTLFALEQDLLTLADAIGSHYFPHGPNASRPEKLTGLA